MIFQIINTLFFALLQKENSSYFVAYRHKLSAFSLIFRFSSCHHPLLACALAKIMQDEGNRCSCKDENPVWQLICMINSDNQHVVCKSLLFFRVRINFKGNDWATSWPFIQESYHLTIGDARWPETFRQ